jgi:hypothetical protein
MRRSILFAIAVIWAAVLTSCGGSSSTAAGTGATTWDSATWDQSTWQ